MRGGKLEQVTRDHSLLQEQIDSGMITKEAARRSQNKNLVTRALGIEPEVEPEIHTYDVQPGDIYLLCSDGLNDMVEDEDIELTLNALRRRICRWRRISWCRWRTTTAGATTCRSS